MRPIHLAQLDKTRPVLLLTRAIAVGRLRTVTVAEITSRIHGLHTEVLVGPANGLDRESAVNLDNVHTIEFSQLGRQVGTLLTSQEGALLAAMAAAYDLETE